MQELIERLDVYGDEGSNWLAPSRMPFGAARIFLRITSVRVERLHDITPIDAWNEGCRIGNSFAWEQHIPELQQQCRDVMFRQLWDAKWAKKGYGWDVNPWVWIYEIEKIEKPTERTSNE
jgi:hypothetical protein